MPKALLILPLLGLAVTAAACQGEAAREPSPTPSPSPSLEVTAPVAPTPTPTVAESPTSEAETPPPAPSPSPPPLTCAAGSTEQFLQAQTGADFAMYCPSYLPQGLTFQELLFTPIGETPPMDAPPPGELDAAFVSADEQTQVVLYEGHLGASFLSSLVQLAQDEGVSPQPVAYGGLEGSLYAPLTSISGVTLGAFVVVQLPDGITHVLHTAEVDVPAVTAIAEAMTPVSP